MSVFFFINFNEGQDQNTQFIRAIKRLPGLPCPMPQAGVPDMNEKFRALTLQAKICCHYECVIFAFIFAYFADRQKFPN